MSVTIQDVIHPLMKAICRGMLNFKLYPFDIHELPKERPIIYVSNHSNAHDIPTLVTIAGDHFYLLADDAPRGTLAGNAFAANGVIWVNRKEKESRLKASTQMKAMLKKGKNLLICPEGTWNLHECLPMLPFSWSTTELAREINCPIVPITLEYPDFNSCYYSIGKPFYVQTGEDKADAVGRLRDIMATMRWSFWESRGLFGRQDITEADFDIYAKKRLEEYPPADYEEEKKMIFNPGNTYLEEAFAHLGDITPRRETAFLFDKKSSGGISSQQSVKM